MAARGVRLPAYSSNIEDWLLHDAFLALLDRVTDKQKYGALIGALPTSIIPTVQHVLAKPPATGKYDALVTALKKRYIREDDKSNFQSILYITLGNLQPSELLQEMQRLNHHRTGKLPNSFIRSLHLSKLPASMQPLRDAVGSDKSDYDYSVLADKFFKRQPAERAIVNSVNQVTKPFDPLQERPQGP